MRVERIQDKAVLRAFLGESPGETAYALGDLPSPNWENAHFYGGYIQAEDEDDEHLRGVLLLYFGFETPVLTMHGSPQAIEGIMREIDLPDSVFCLVPDIFIVSVGMHYGIGSLYPVRRMVVTKKDFTKTKHSADIEEFNQRLVRMTAEDADRLNRFYQQDAGRGEEILSFSPQQVADGVFFAIERDGDIRSAAGTHVVAVGEKVAAVGNILTAPIARGQQFATIVTSKVTETLLKLGIQTIVLNVKKDNIAAIRVYEKLGYRHYAGLMEGPADKKH